VRSTKWCVLPFLFVFAAAPVSAHGSATAETCARPKAGSVIAEPPILRSQDSVLRAELTYVNFTASDGQVFYCYLSQDGAQAPTLRVQPGDLVILRLKNELHISAQPSAGSTAMKAMTMSTAERCAGPHMTAFSTNLHFHGLDIPPTCHQDDVLNTAIEPRNSSFEYRFRIPADEPPGLYWYHPHIHGLTNQQVLGGASGAIIVEGIERAYPQLAGLPDRLFIIRDQNLMNPGAEPAKSNGAPSPVLRDAEGDILNTGTGGGKPAKDLSINFVPVPYPDYPPAAIVTRPVQRELWRVLNASAITYLDLEVVMNNEPLTVGVVSVDGVPIDENGMSAHRVLWETHVVLPPAGRVEFIFKGLPKGTRASLITRSMDTGPAGENDPIRPLAKIEGSETAQEPALRLSDSVAPLQRAPSIWLGNVKPLRTRTLYFSERPQDPNDPKSPTVFMITVDGEPPAPFDPSSTMPHIVATQGDVEDWIIENRSTEVHAFHIHQLHFLLLEWNGVSVDEPFLRDTLNVTYWDGKSAKYPSIKVRMDFRDPHVVGTFAYHCHLLEHEDGGMMGIIQVQHRPANSD
jgi:FtsP/CotA-like multicopper oxidase with cupredoxin domain